MLRLSIKQHIIIDRRTAVYLYWQDKYTDLCHVDVLKYTNTETHTAVHGQP